MKIGLSLLLKFAVVLSCAVEYIIADEVHGCYRRQRELIERHGPSAEVQYWFPKCLTGGYYQNVQCNFFGCYCAYIDTGERIPRTLANVFILFMRDYCPWTAKTAPDPCTMPPADYPCKQTSTKYYFNPQRGECEASGSSCLGFDTMEACSKSCVVTKKDKCNFKIDEGKKCEGRQPAARWYHDEVLGTCTPFYYNGCGGNSNNYADEWICLKSCEYEKNMKLIVQVEQMKYYIKLPKWIIVKNMYDTKKVNPLTVEEFKELEGYLVEISKVVSSGDKDKPTSYDYEKYRPEHASKNMSREELCGLKKDYGPCRGFFPRWYFDAEKSKCVKFIYGGCYGNENRFEAASSCATFCNAKVKPSEEELFEEMIRGTGVIGGLPKPKPKEDEDDDHEGSRSLVLGAEIIIGESEIGFSFDDEIATTAPTELSSKGTTAAE